MARRARPIHRRRSVLPAAASSAINGASPNTLPANKEVTGMAPRRTVLDLEPLGARVLPSATVPLPAAPLAAALTPTQPALHLLQGHGRGSYTANAVISDAGAEYRLHGI